jgi:hypothetical protein
MNLQSGAISIRLTTGAQVMAGTLAGIPTWNITSTSDVDLEVPTHANRAAQLTIAAANRNVTCRGHFANIVAVGTSSKVTSIEGRSDGGIDVTGPADFDLSGGQMSIAVIVRGTGVQGKCSRVTAGAVITYIQFIAAIECALDVRLTPIGSAGGKAYSFDASSHNNILRIIGSRNAAYTTPSTDLGTLNRVITEAGDSYAGAAPSPTPGIDEGLLLMGWYS